MSIVTSFKMLGIYEQPRYPLGQDLLNKVWYILTVLTEK
jgi:hypothetical protein